MKIAYVVRYKLRSLPISLFCGSILCFNITYFLFVSRNSSEIDFVLKKNRGLSSFAQQFFVLKSNGNISLIANDKQVNRIGHLVPGVCV